MTTPSGGTSELKVPGLGVWLLTLAARPQPEVPSSTWEVPRLPRLPQGRRISLK